MTANLRIALTATAVLIAGGGAYVVVFGLSEPPLPPPRIRVQAVTPPRPILAPPPPAPEAAFVLADAQGDVQVLRNGAWTAVTSGQKLAASEKVRTGPDGHATLRDGQGDELVLRERVELEVRELSQTVAALSLTRGKIKAAPAPGQTTLEIDSGQARAVGHGGSRFTIYADARGAVAVASDGGDVEVASGGQTIALPEHTQTVIEPGKRPSSPVAIPADVFLAVSWPDKVVHAARTTVAGKVAAGTAVRVNGEPVVVASDGSFHADLPLREGANPVVVQAEALDGREKSAAQDVTSRTAGPPLEADPSKMFDPSPKRSKP